MSKKLTKAVEKLNEAIVATDGGRIIAGRTAKKKVSTKTKKTKSTKSTKSSGKRAPSAYNLFIRDNIGSFTGTQQQKFKKAVGEWRKLHPK